MIGHVNTTNQSFQSIQQITNANSGNIQTNYNLIKNNTTQIHVLHTHATNTRKKSEIIIAGIPSVVTNPHSEIINVIFTKIGATKILPLIHNSRNFLSKPSSTSTDPANAPAATYSIAVHLLSTDALDAIIDCKRNYKELKCADVFSNEALTGLIYINELLPSYTYKLLKRTRTIAKNKGYEFVWVQSATIYVRKDDASNRIPILCESNLSTLP